MYVLTTNGHGPLVRPIRTHESGHTAGRRFATVRTSSGAWVSGEVIRIWESEAAAMRDRFRPEQRRRDRADSSSKLGQAMIEATRNER